MMPDFEYKYIIDFAVIDWSLILTDFNNSPYTKLNRFRLF